MLSEIKADNPKQLRAYLDSRTSDISSDILLKVNEIIKRVKQEGDAALKDYTRQFDGVEIENFRVSEKEIDDACALTDKKFREALTRAKDNITAFHMAQKTNSYLMEREPGVYLGQRVLPLASVGIYVPGGRAQYPSSVLMNVIPAKVAGVKRIVMVTPPGKDGRLNPNIAFAARLAGVCEIYKVGGAQAIAALAWGTESIAPVDKITGPGNIFVAAAKKLVFGRVDIDMIAGPSEILVIADDGADPACCAADLLSQAEHDPMASAILLTTSRSFQDHVNKELARQLETLPKKEIASASIRDYGRSIVAESLEQCIAYANAIAPEHLELMIKDPMPYLSQVKNAGSVFLGYDTCEPIGDYYGGTNHVLPTGGTARFASALGVDAFVHRSCFLHYSKKALQQDGDDIMILAKEEQLEAHARAVEVRNGKN